MFFKKNSDNLQIASNLWFKQKNILSFTYEISARMSPEENKESGRRFAGGLLEYLNQK